MKQDDYKDNIQLEGISSLFVKTEAIDIAVRSQTTQEFSGTDMVYAGLTFDGIPIHLPEALVGYRIGERGYLHVDMSRLSKSQIDKSLKKSAERSGEKSKGWRLWIALPPRFGALEMHTRSGGICGSFVPASEEIFLEKLLVNTLTGDISWKKGCGKKVNITTTSGDILIADNSFNRMEVYSLSGTLQLSDSNLKHMKFSCLRGESILSNVTVSCGRIVAKTGQLQLQQVQSKEMTMELGRADVQGKCLRGERWEAKSLSGDMSLEFVQDVELSLESVSGALEVQLENDYRGFTAKVDTSELLLHGRSTLTQVRYGRYCKDYEGDCKIACNEKSSHLQIRTGGETVKLTGSGKRKTSV